MNLGITSIDRLERELDALDDDDPSVETLARQVLDVDSAHVAATNQLGILLQKSGRLEEALEVFVRGAIANSGNVIAKRRVAEVRRDIARRDALALERSKVKRRDPADIVEPGLEGSGRDASILFLAWSIRPIQQIDPNSIGCH